MEFNDLNKKYEKKGKKLRDNGFVKEIIFSENIYEIEIYDPLDKKSYWPFLQLDDEKNILDAFCSCKEQEAKGYCRHLAASYLKVCEKDQVLHVRFKKSFFNCIFQIISFQIGFDKNLLKKKKDGSYYYTKNKKDIFFILPKTKEGKKRLKDILSAKTIDEEMSIKFSAHSFEEINLYKKGRASNQLKYELSFFSDIAKWFFMMQSDNEKYQIKYNKTDFLPNFITVDFKNIEATFYIPESSWKYLIDSLSTVESSLKVFKYEERKIKNIHFDQKNVCFDIKSEPGLPKQKKPGVIEGKIIDKWKYVEGKGFYLNKPDELYQLDHIYEDKISYFLSKYTEELQKYLDTKIYPKEISLQYYLFFDQDNNFHIRSYLFDVEDFDKSHSRFFKNWVYIQDKGFYKLGPSVFDAKETIIHKENMSEFITKNRHWLYNFQGFQTNFGTIESYLVYSLSKEENLIFSSKFELPEDLEDFIDFDDWLYIKGKGFYSKKEKQGIMPVRPGLVIKKEEISKFIKNHIDELEQISNFFISKQPIEKIGLEIILNQDEKIVVKPKIILKKGYNIEDILFFDNFGYIQNKGFFEIPKKFKLPQRYEKEKIITVSNESFFITYELQKLKPFIVNLDDRLKIPKKLSLKLLNIIKKTHKNKKSWLADLVYVSEIGSVNATDLQQAVLQQKKYFYSDAGLIFLKKARFNWFRTLSKKQAKKAGGYLKLSTLEWIRLLIFEDLKPPKTKTKEALQTKKLLEEIKNFETDKLINIEPLKAKLRPYQELGVKWLWFLYCHSLSGLLCDEMGLGKTHQAMALIAASIDKGNKYLVVCPTSVIYHWQELIKTFLPSLKVYVYHGLLRNIEKFEDYDILLTSYGILRSEKESLKKIKFEIAIFDEVQIAKNANSLTHKSLKAINSNMRLGLTGTPIENYLKELKAIFDLIMPTYLPTDSQFKEIFINPIEKEKDIERKKLLKKIIKPFILRRKKKEVLKDLPEKIEEIAYFDLSDEQKQLYNKIIASSKKHLIKDLKDNEKPISYIHIFSLLSKLKQICDHPSLILKDTKAYQKHKSGKFELFQELINEAMESSQKVVVFSQYLDMIQIIENYLKSKKIGYASIKGKTKKRYEQIKKFKEDPNCVVFVASLLAAGVGIDLSTASIVIHYDRWWNPAKENQATDRVHRLGQNRGVQVFKLVAKNTIEEKIHEIIEKKQTLIEETIGKDEADQIKALSRDELIDVLKKIEGS